MEKLKIIIFANTPAKREKGLMFLDKMEENECALFVFPKDSRQSFWNRNVEFNIDVAFFDKNEELIKVDKLKAHQEKPVVCDDVRFVIETNSGWFEKNEVSSGHNMWDLISIEGFKR